MCDEFSELDVLEFCQGTRSGPAAGRIAAHLLACPDCQAVERSVRALRSLADEPPPAVSRDADRRVRAAISQAAQGARAVPRVVSRRRVWQAAASLAAAVAVVVGAWWLSAGPSETATLAEVHGDVLLRRGERQWVAAAGTVLRPHDTVTVPTGGSAVVSLPWSGRAELGSHTTVEVASSARDALFLKEGFIDVEVPGERADRTVRVRTPGAEAAVHGTRFTMAAGDGDTALRVESGQVQFTRTADGAGVVVPAGHRAAVAGGASEPGMTPVPTRTGEVLLVVSRERPNVRWDRFNQLLEDRLVGERLQRMAYRVVVKNHTELTPADVAGRSLVVVSVAGDDVGLEQTLVRVGLDTADVPVLCLEPVAYPALGMTGPLLGRDFGFSKLPGMTVHRPGHPLAGGTGAAGRVTAGKSKLGWGTPAPAATVVYTLEGEPDHAVMFGYEAGARMVGRTAPGRRVGLFLDPNDAIRPKAVGWNLFDAAVEWCADRAVLAALTKKGF